MKGENVVKGSELIKFLKRQGCCLLRHGSRHDIWANPKTGGITEMPRHQTADIPTGTVNKILKDLGLK
ncbi:MAG: type II toxin-antitoxin system HicA family toxin [Oscillospiraceae bacterium]|nr:type II toxin-antitoxin system HicA family toxin [Oscillospiraceae bacterium]